MVTTQDIRNAVDIALDEVDNPECCTDNDMDSFKKRFDSLFISLKLEVEEPEEVAQPEDVEMRVPEVEEDSSAESNLEAAPNSSEDSDLIYDQDSENKE